MAGIERFVKRRQPAFGKLIYFSVAAVLFLLAAWNRFSLPQDPFAVYDTYLWPALMKLSGGTFAHTQGLNFLYPGVVYLILRICADFRAISVIQHILGLIAGGLFLASWSRLADFFQKPRLNRIAHEAIGLWGAAIYLVSSAPAMFEMNIRADSVCMFFEMLVFWLVVQFFYYRVISPDAAKVFIYGTAIAVNVFLLASLKPSFTLMALFVIAPVIWLIVNAQGHFLGKAAFVLIGMCIIITLTLTEHFLRRNDEAVKTFLPETLFAIHAEIIQEQMAADLKNGETAISSREWLRHACDDLEIEIQRSHTLYPKGVSANYLMVGTNSLLKRWRGELGDERFLRFLRYWYWHSVASRPLSFAGKIASQLGVFYSRECPAFSIHKKLPLARSYAASFSALSRPPTLQLLAKGPPGSAFLERTQKLRFIGVVIHQNKQVQAWNIWCARSFLAILLVSLPLVGWFVLKRSNSEESKWPAFLVLLLYSTSFGNVLGISVVHSMVVNRYSTVLFLSALFAQFWAIRWLTEVSLGIFANQVVMGSRIT